MGPAHAGEDFPVTRCSTCDREVLCYFELGDDDREHLRCVHCGTPPDAMAVRWVDLRGVEALGYGAMPSDGGCGRPDCGTGRCGTRAPG